MSTDDQDIAEGIDDDMIGRGDHVTSDEVDVDFPPTSPSGLQFADADVTDESFAQRTLAEEPEVSEADIDERDADADEVLGAIDLDSLVVDD